MESCCRVVELRQYTLHRYTRETLVRVFEDHFVEGQEQHGMRIVGQFRDLDGPDRFVWIRGFASMDARTRALEAFYSSPVWKEHGPAANATMIDYTDVLLLRPADQQTGFRFDPSLRPPRGGREVPGGVVVATIYHLAVPISPDVVASLLRGESETGTVLGQFVTEPARNPFARLPVREDANVFVSFTSYPSADAYRPPVVTLAAISREEHLRLEPTPRSFLRYHPTPTHGR